MNPIAKVPAQGVAPVLPKTAASSSRAGGSESKAPEEVKLPTPSKAIASASRAVAEVNLDSYASASKDVMQLVSQQLQSYLKESGRSLTVRIDESSGRYVARVINPETGEVVRSLPSDESLRIVRNIEQMRGMLVNQKV